MRESFILIILPLLVIVGSSHVYRDSFNLYKDRMQTGSRDNSKTDSIAGTNIWDSYATPQGFEYLNAPIWLPEYKKRASTLIKKRMMDQYMQDERLKKRTSKAALSLMMQSKQDPGNMEEENSCFAGK